MREPGVEAVSLHSRFVRGFLARVHLLSPFVQGCFARAAEGFHFAEAEVEYLMTRVLRKIALWAPFWGSRFVPGFRAQHEDHKTGWHKKGDPFSGTDWGPQFRLSGELVCRL